MIRSFTDRPFPGRVAEMRRVVTYAGVTALALLEMSAVAVAEPIARWAFGTEETTKLIEHGAVHRDLLDEQLAERIVTLLEVHDVPIGALQVEITESVLMTDPDRARTMLEKLRDIGLRIAVDDYGTGYCALAYLRDLPIDELAATSDEIGDAQRRAETRAGFIRACSVTVLAQDYVNDFA